MAFSTLTIESAPKKNKSSKTRTFSVHLLGYLAADTLWASASDGPATRPVWLAYFGTERESQPFTANLRAGRRARTETEVFELGGRLHRWTTRKVPNGVITVAYLPGLFHLEPPEGSAPEKVRFVFAPPLWWLAQEAQGLVSEFGEAALDAARAALFCAYLDRRTPLPLVHDLSFHLQVYRAALGAGWVHPLSADRSAVLRGGGGGEAVGLDTPLACSVGQAELNDFLIQQTSLYPQEIRHGAPRIAAAGRLLSKPPETPAELRIDRQVA